jgi:predicted nucleotidyltransferase
MAEPASLAAACRAHDVARLWLFGSRVRGDARPDSDMDILVEFEPNAAIGMIELARLRDELSVVFARRVDLVPLRGLKPAIRAEVLAARELLYAA